MENLEEMLNNAEVEIAENIAPSTVRINDRNLVESFDVRDATREIEITPEQWERISTCDGGYAWRYDENTKDFEKVLNLDANVLRERRDLECFPIINRGALWYDLLTDDQKAELKAWYQAWLNVTETLVVPEKPDWLN